MRRYITILMMILLSTVVAQGQIRIGGNVYGGGNHAEVKGSTKVTVRAGDIGAVIDPDDPEAKTKRPLEDPQGKVFGGARMANVGGNTFVHIDGESELETGTPNYILVNHVYGGNDISGTIGTAKAVGESIPDELSAVKREQADANDDKKNAVNDEFNSYVRISTKTLDPKNAASYYTAEEIAAAATDPEAAAYGKRTTDIKPDPDARKVYIGQLFAGGNGDFDYTDDSGNPLMDETGEYIIEKGGKIIARSATPFVLPELDKTYLEVVGGSIVYAYGGGNKVTVKEQNIIHIDNPSAVVNHIKVDATGKEDANGTDLLKTERFKEMGINTGFSKPSSGEYQVGRFFGGNNKATMTIRPMWNLLSGKVRNMYSGGNKGDMTSPVGLLLEIPETSSLIVDNLFGGCRMADVHPKDGGVGPDVSVLNEDFNKALKNTDPAAKEYNFPDKLTARVLVRGGHINNVYGGNDVTGKVYGGNAIGIYTTVYGDVYGGGNGYYPYTDALKDDDVYGDFYFEQGEADGLAAALNAFRPNAERVSIRLKGDAGNGGKPNYTIIQGSVYLGGNCATIVSEEEDPMLELKIGSYVIADKVFLGNNGEGMIDPDYLKLYAGNIDEDGYYTSGEEGRDFSNLNLSDNSVFSTYMEGVAMSHRPNIVFDGESTNDPEIYEPYSSYIGSLYCGGNVGSMTFKDKATLNIRQGLNIYEKFVGGCNNADVPEGTYNAAYEGGVIGADGERGLADDDHYTDSGEKEGNIKDRIEINFANMVVAPLRWNDEFEPVTNGTTLTKGKVYYKTDDRDSKYVAKGIEVASADNVYYVMTTLSNELIWNTQKWNREKGGFEKVGRDPTDDDIRLVGGNVYGGCYESGHVNGNIVININEDMLKRKEVFGTEAPVGKREASGVSHEDQRDDLKAVSLSVFGAGYGKETEIWGSTTVNMNKGYVFQVFGGGEQGVVGKGVTKQREKVVNDVVQTDTNGDPVMEDYRDYTFNPRYSCTVNLKGDVTASSNEDDVQNLAETEYVYGGGNEGDVCGNTLVNLGNGRIYDAFGGACDANILGHAEVYIGRQPDKTGAYTDGFPWIDVVYGGSDFGGTIYGAYDDKSSDFETSLKARLRDYDTDKTQLHGYNGDIPEVLKSSTYVEYLQGSVESIFGGGYGEYDYTDTNLYGVGSAMPKQHSSFVNIRPKDHNWNALTEVYGGGSGSPGNRDDDKAQDRSYVLIDIPNGMKTFENLEVFGAGNYNGLGMKYTKEQTFSSNFNLDEASAIVDLLHGKIKNAYGGSYQEGVTRHTVVNVPAESTIQIDNIYGGAYGKYILPPCDVYETQVNYKNTSGNAQVSGAIYGGNNNERRSLFTHVNISSTVWSNKVNGETGTVYGAGRGFDTWSEYTEVNLLDDARVYEVYGGGKDGHVLNAFSVQDYMKHFEGGPSQQIVEQDSYWKNHNDDLTSVDEETQTAAKNRWKNDWKTAWKIDGYYNPDGTWTDYATNDATSLEHVSDRAELDDKTKAQLDGAKKHNTNVIVHQGAVVEGYVYGGGLGDAEVPLSGDVYGSTYVAVLGGEVKKDISGGGHVGSLDCLFGAEDFADSRNKFTATANTYVRGGTVRNVYGGGYEGHVGHHDGEFYTDYAGDRPAECYVVIGKTGDNTYEGGAPAITRNVYGGGEGGSVYGSSHVTLNNGYIGYRYENTGTEESPKYEYVEELDDNGQSIDLAGNVFGGGYVANSYIDNTNVNLYGGIVRGSVFGGGEIGPVGRGTVKYKDTYPTSKSLVNGNARIYKAGQTHVKMYNGHVLRNVFGGGRGKDSWGGDGTKYMDPAVVERLDMKVKGYVFGQTDVNIYGGEIGTNEGLASGFGNVFGGGDEGFVYSAYEQNGNLFIGNKVGERYDKGDEGYYYRYNGSKYVNTEGAEIADNAEKYLTEDCHVLVEPWLQVKAPIEYNSHAYKTGDYIPTAYLNTLPKKDKNDTSWPAEWNNVDAGSLVGEEYVERGVIIHNAVFAGGNIAIGGELYANTTTVFGNATASIHDVYNRDLITVGRIYVGGLYGDGNLTFVDGYRELNVTNYGTDYYNIKEEISNDVYNTLPPREQAYYELKFKCIAPDGCTDNEGTHYTYGTNVPLDELLVLFEGRSEIIQNGEPNPAYWTENGVVSRYAGRYLNTIQRADFCGVFGSRTVMKGARDRVLEVDDGTNYTINRVREVSLNKKASTAGDVGEYATHGNYFGIYSVVNYLGALTSDLNFYNDARTTNNKDHVKYVDPLANEKPYGTATYADWKEEFSKDPRRNNGLSHNEVALASGVHLELTTEESKGNTLDTKEWGIITGVVQLDLINVAKGIGGGFVYAKNIHGVRESSDKTKEHTILTDLNLHGGVGNTPAVTNRIYKYIETDATATDTQKEWQTSGNFVHNTEIIIDDCYNISGRYQIGNRVPAHYWYIKGSVYVYDQYITAQTGSANAYSKNVELPITVSAAVHNQMKLLDVQPNLYAYYSSYNASSSTGTPLGSEQKLLIQDNEYYLNTPISYWDWSLLPASEQHLFVKETYVTSEKCKIGNEIVSSDLVLLPNEYTAYKNAATMQVIDGKSVKAVIKVIQDKDGNDVVATDKYDNPIYVPFTSVFHSSNEMSHDTGYLLTYKMTNPKLWDTWYTEAAGTAPKAQDKKVEGWNNGPTYYLHTTEGQLLGQHEYKVTDIIPYSVYKSYDDIDDEHIPNYNKSEGDEGYDATKKQATFEEAYVITAECSDDNRHYYKGAPVSKKVGTSQGVSAEKAYVCTGSIDLGSNEYIFINDLLTYGEKEALKNKYQSLASDIDELIVPAYYCTESGLYGGNYYVPGKNYRALEAWSSMSESDRKNFTFNYDAFDLIIDNSYGKAEGHKYQYDSATGTLEGAQANPAQYSLETPLDYTATFENTSLKLENGQTIKVTRGGVENTVITGDESEVAGDNNSIKAGDVIDRDEFESKLLNEQYHYAPIDVTDDNKSTPIYVVKESFYYKESFAAGQVIDAATYSGLPSSDLSKVDVLDFSTKNKGIYYYCRDSYEIDGTYGTAVKDIANVSHSSTVTVGTILSSTEYGKLKNQQLGFSIHGVSPMETSTLYVSRDANFDDLSTEKIITVIYQYDYEESDESGAHITPVSERHVVRIHVIFEDGIPSVEDIREPDIVLPGHSITMRVPGVSSNGYEIIGGGWELYETKEDAESHFCGKDYTPGTEPLYWYQDDYYIAYYAKTYNRGKTYSNYVPVHVANYHDLKEVMDDKQYHLHVDYDRTQLKRDSKIYINDYSGSSQNGLDLFKNFYDLSLISASGDGYTVTDGKISAATETANTNLVGHALLNTHVTNGVKGGQNLEFFLRTDISHPKPWTAIGTDDICFKGNLHGDGHTISGLNNSLFYNLCGSVYNLGVTGSFNSAGVVDKGSGYVESAWVNTTGTPDGSVRAVFGTPTAESGYKQIVNSYCQTGKTYETTDTDNHGLATAMPDNAFYNGEVAYDLNNFYLYKRYNDGVGTASGVDYKYYTLDATGNIPSPKTPQTGYYDNSIALCSSGYNGIKYVEERFADGDFRYAAGEIPTSEEERLWVDTEHDNKPYWFPIWPDDYIFFGQKLTYGWGAQVHQDVPTAVARYGGRLSQDDNANRVYRAPAYYRSMEMGVAHFNPTVYLAQQEKLTDEQIAAHATPHKAYPGMTAIDFAGHYYDAYASYGDYEKGNDGGLFYTPVLDDDGLLSIQNCDETQNLLVYAPSSGVNSKTYDVLNSYFTEPVFDTNYDNSHGYHLVSKTSTGSIHGHLVQSNLEASNDHLLVDKQDFNCPIGYQFKVVGNEGYRMWYQRNPVIEYNLVKAGTTLTDGKRYYTSNRGTGGFVSDGTELANGTNYYELTVNYVGYKDPEGHYISSSAGWDAISLPFKAELVTTNDKGEITHFYDGSDESRNDDNPAKIGHEYWLRGFKSGGTFSGTVYAANFKRPGESSEDGDKIYTNTFLWDYYYSYNNLRDHDNTTGEDKNNDEYQEYYKSEHTYRNYPRLAAAMPYIIGFPGERYYEFDLSGHFEAGTAKETYPKKLGAQTITFASKPGAAIAVSDDEIADAIDGNTDDDDTNKYTFTFKANYLNKPEVESGKLAFLLNSDGSCFEKTDATTALYAFRPFFTADRAPSPTRTIIFGEGPTDEQKGVEEHGDPTKEELNGGLRIWTKKDKIYVESSLSFTEDMRVVTPAGITVATFSVKPGKTVEVQADFSGMYIVHTLDGKYTKKVAVKRE